VVIPIILIAKAARLYRLNTSYRTNIRSYFNGTSRSSQNWINPGSRMRWRDSVGCGKGYGRMSILMIRSEAAGRLMSRIFWDTNLFIYLLEDYGALSKRVAEVRKRMTARRDQLYTSTLSLGEILVKPARPAMKQEFKSLSTR